MESSDTTRSRRGPSLHRLRSSGASPRTHPTLLIKLKLHILPPRRRSRLQTQRTCTTLLKGQKAGVLHSHQASWQQEEPGSRASPPPPPPPPPRPPPPPPPIRAPATLIKGQKAAQPNVANPRLWHQNYAHARARRAGDESHGHKGAENIRHPWSKRALTRSTLGPFPYSFWRGMPPWQGPWLESPRPRPSPPPVRLYRAHHHAPSGAEPRARAGLRRMHHWLDPHQSTSRRRMKTTGGPTRSRVLRAFAPPPQG